MGPGYLRNCNLWSSLLPRIVSSTLSSDLRSIHVHAPATEIYKCLHDWSGHSTWTDILISALSLFPTHRFDRGSLLADLICDVVGPSTGVGEIDNAELPCWTYHKESCSCAERKLQSVKDYLAAFLNVATRNLAGGSVLVAHIPSGILNFLNGRLLKAFLQVLRCHSLFLAPFDRLELSELEMDPYCLMFGLGPLRLRAGDVVLNIEQAYSSTKWETFSYKPVFRKWVDRQRVFEMTGETPSMEIDFPTNSIEHGALDRDDDSDSSVEMRPPCRLLGYVYMSLLRTIGGPQAAFMPPYEVEYLSTLERYGGYDIDSIRNGRWSGVHII